MKHLSKSTTQKALFIAVLLLTIPAMHVFAAPPFPGGDPGAPLDGGISLLIAAGAGYGVRKARDARKKAKAAEGSEAKE